jgi:hypothetical protein
MTWTQHMLRQPLTAFLTILLAALAVGAAGCHRDGLAEQRLTLREERLAKTVHAIAESERTQPKQLARCTDQVATALLPGMEEWRATVEGCERYWQREWILWGSRRDNYGRQAGEFLRGEPEHIERHAIILFF